MGLALLAVLTLSAIVNLGTFALRVILIVGLKAKLKIKQVFIKKQLNKVLKINKASSRCEREPYL